MESDFMDFFVLAILPLILVVGFINIVRDDDQRESIIKKFVEKWDAKAAAQVKPVPAEARKR